MEPGSPSRGLHFNEIAEIHLFGVEFLPEKKDLTGYLKIDWLKSCYMGITHAIIRNDLAVWGLARWLHFQAPKGTYYILFFLLNPGHKFRKDDQWK
jgi:hypothetical protein